MSAQIQPSSSSVDAMSAEEALGGLYEAYWRMQSAIAKKVKEETAGLPDFLKEDAAKEIRRTCFPEEKKLWEDAYRRVMSALLRHGLETGPDAPQTHAAASQTADSPERAPEPSYAQEALL